MLVDLPRVADSLDEGTLEARLARRRDQILRELTTTGTSSFTEDGRTFTLTLARPNDTGSNAAPQEMP